MLSAVPDDRDCTLDAALADPDRRARQVQANVTALRLAVCQEMARDKFSDLAGETAKEKDHLREKDTA